MENDKKVYKVVEIQSYQNLINEEQKKLSKKTFLVGMWATLTLMSAIKVGECLGLGFSTGIFINLLACGLDIVNVIKNLKDAIAGLKKKLMYDILKGNAESDLENSDVDAQLEEITKKENEAIQLLLEMGYRIEEPEEMQDGLSDFENEEGKGMRR